MGLFIGVSGGERALLKTLPIEGPLPATCAVTGPLFRVVATETRVSSQRALDAETRVSSQRALDAETRVSGRRALDAETRVSGRRALMLRRGCRADAPWC